MHYHQIQICVRQSLHTTFIPCVVQYECTVIACGPANALSQSIAVVNLLIAFNPKPHQFIALNLESVIIHSSTWAKNLDHMRNILHPIQKDTLRLARSKCERFCNEIKLFRLQIKREDKHTLHSKIKVVTKCPCPRNKGLVSSLLHPMEYYQKFILLYIRIALL